MPCQNDPTCRVALWDDKLKGLISVLEPWHSTFLGGHALHLKTWQTSAKISEGHIYGWNMGWQPTTLAFFPSNHDLYLVMVNPNKSKRVVFSILIYPTFQFPWLVSIERQRLSIFQQHALPIHKRSGQANCGWAVGDFDKKSFSWLSKHENSSILGVSLLLVVGRWLGFGI